MTPEVIVDTPSALAGVFVRRFEALAADALAARGRFTCALSGGSVAEVFFPALVGAAVDWRRIDLFWGDERAVPPDDPESNYGLARRLWLDGVPVDPARVHPILATGGDLDAAAAAYEHELSAALAGRPLDFVLLGLGPEGHVCSLFPDSPALHDSTRLAVAVRDSPKPPPRRVTLTLVPMRGSPLVCVAAFDRSKAAAVRDVVEVPGSASPGALAVRGAARALLLLDEDAASGLTRR